MIQKFNFGEIWLADLNPPSGAEPGKFRPVLIMQNQELLNVGHPSTIIIPLTTNLIEDAEPLRIRVKAFANLEKDSDLLIDQIRAIDNRRLIRGPLGKCEGKFMMQVQQAIVDVLGITLSEDSEEYSLEIF